MLALITPTPQTDTVGLCHFCGNDDLDIVEIQTADGSPAHALQCGACACPFCGEDDAEVVQTHADVFVVQCGGCGTQGPSGETADQAIEAWTSRRRVLQGAAPPVEGHTTRND